MKRLNQYAINFISLVKTTLVKNEPSQQKGSFEHQTTVDWSDKVVPGPVIITQMDHDNFIEKIYLEIEGKRFGFEDAIYPHFIKFTSHIALLSIFINEASEKFILRETFNWVVDAFINKQIKQDLILHLQNRLSEEIEEVKYHFPVLNLNIEEPFQIGNCTFQYFTKQFFDDYWNELKEKKEKKEEFDALFENYCGRVFVSYTARAESGKAEEIAFKEVCLSMDVFRLFSPAIVTPLKLFKVDLEKRININFSNQYLAEKINPERTFLINLTAHNDPFYFNNKFKYLAIATGLQLFSQFIKENKNDELGRLIKESISLYSFILSMPDSHLRIMQLVMLLEGLLLESGFVRGMESKVKDRCGKFMFPRNSTEYNMLRSCLTEMYKVRHQMTHKVNRIPIDKIKFTNLQITLVELLKKLIITKPRFTTKEELINYIDSIP